MTAYLEDVLQGMLKYLEVGWLIEKITAYLEDVLQGMLT